MALIIEKVKKYICISRVYKLHSITVYIFIYLQKKILQYFVIQYYPFKEWVI